MDENEARRADEHAEVIGRLRAYSAAPLDTGLAARTLERLHGHPPGWRRLPLKLLVAAAIGAFAFGGVGLAAADVLPAPVQDVAHTALDRVGVHVPPGHDRYNDPAACPGGPYRNHGAYVRAHQDDPNAGKSPCGKPVRSTGHPGANDGKDDTGAGNPNKGAGPPPWAHGNGKNKTKHTDQADHKKAASNGSDASEPDERHDDAAPPATTTTPTSATMTTTSAPPASTTSTSAA